MATRKAMMVTAAGVAAAIFVAILYLVPGRSTDRDISRSLPKTITTHDQTEPETAPLPTPKYQKRPPAYPITLKRTMKTPAVPKRVRKAPAFSREDRLIMEKLEEQGLSRRNASHLVREDYAILDDEYEHLSKASNWLSELQKASSSIMIGKDGKPSMLRIYDVSDDSLLREFGIQDEDVVMLINGEIPVFEPSRAVEYTQKAWSLLTDLQNGKAISVTILRCGEPINLVYQRWW